MEGGMKNEECRMQNMKGGIQNMGKTPKGCTDSRTKNNEMKNPEGMT